MDFITPRAAESLAADRKYYKGNYAKASRSGYLDALADIVNASVEAGEILPDSVIAWINNNS